MYALRSIRTLRQAVLVAALVVLAHVSPVRADDIIIKLRKDFIEQHKNRVTIAANLTIDQVGKIHPPSKDGDLHMAGRAPEIQLPIVAEIKNAKFELDTVINARQAAQMGQAVPVRGAWRIWCEHANSGNHIQGAELQPFPDSNPPHVFEIHPLTDFNGTDLRKSIRGIDGYKYKDATRAFLQYENTRCKLVPNGDMVTIRTQGAGYNHVEFIMQSVDELVGGFAVEDGRFLMAQVRDLDGELLVRKVRMAFIKDTEAEKMARTLKKHERLRVVAIPRVSLSLVSWRVAHANDAAWKDFEPLEWHLPYEMIVIGVTTEESDGDADE